MPPPVRVLALRGVDGNVEMGEEASAIGFLRDAAEWSNATEILSFAVPFQRAALEIVASCCRTSWSQYHADKSRSTREHATQDRTTLPYECLAPQLDTISVDVLFEVLRAANFLDCQPLLIAASKATGRLLSSVHRDPEILLSILLPVSRSWRPASCGPGTDPGYIPWSLNWHGAVNEPVLSPPTGTAFTEGHAIEDEDALTLCLLECNVATLRALKGLSPSWRERARVSLNDPRWQLSQTHIDMEWALGVESGSDLSRNRWMCAARLAEVLPLLVQAKVHGVSIDLRVLREAVHLNARTLRHATVVAKENAGVRSRPRGLFGAINPATSQPTTSHTATLKRALSPAPERGMRGASRLVARMAAAPAGLELFAALWAIAHAPWLESVDLSTYWGEEEEIPTDFADGLAHILRTSGKSVQNIKLRTCIIPIHRLRPLVDSPSDRPVAPAGGEGDAEADGVTVGATEGAAQQRARDGSEADVRADDVIDFRQRGIGSTDLTLLARAVGNLGHVSDLDLSRNGFGDAGLHVLVNEAIRTVIAPTMSGGTRLSGSVHQALTARLPATVAAKSLLAGLRWLGLNDCMLGHSGIEHLAMACAVHGLFPSVEHLSLVGNKIGDRGLGSLANAFRIGAMPRLRHLK